MGPSEEDEAEFAKELAKMVTDNADSRKVDKKTALALWDQTIPPPVVRKKRGDDIEDADPTGTAQDDSSGMMKFTLFTKRGNKPQVATAYNEPPSFGLMFSADEATRHTSRVISRDTNAYRSDAR